MQLDVHVGEDAVVQDMLAGQSWPQFLLFLRTLQHLHLLIWSGAIPTIVEDTTTCITTYYSDSDYCQ